MSYLVGRVLARELKTNVYALVSLPSFEDNLVQDLNRPYRTFETTAILLVVLDMTT